MKPVIHIEVIKLLSSKCKTKELQTRVLDYFRRNSNIVPCFSHIITEFDDPLLLNDVQQIEVFEPDYSTCSVSNGFDKSTTDVTTLDSYDVKVYVYQLDTGGIQSENIEDDGEDGQEVACASNHCVLPSQEFHGIWESLVFDDNIKQMLLQYAETSMKFSHSKVDSNIISWNRVILLHGPPGTGKTSLCKAVAQKLAIRLSHEFKIAEFIEINSHSLFSKYFSESGKLVQKMFSKIKRAVEYEDSLVCLLIDEIESLTRARESVLAGTEPSDGVRVVNAVLTQIDQLKRYPNVLIFTTSNLTGAIDLAFVDRADIKQYIGLPSAHAIFKIFNSCLEELLRTKFVVNNSSSEYEFKENLMEICRSCSGLSGRALRKIPFLTFVKYIPQSSIDLTEYFKFLKITAEDVLAEQNSISKDHEKIKST